MLSYKGQSNWSADGEGRRAAVNTAIRSGGLFDAVIDFAATMADKDDPDRLSPAAKASDALHPAPDGHKVIGSSIELSIFRSLSQ